MNRTASLLISLMFYGLASSALPAPSCATLCGPLAPFAPWAEAVQSPLPASGVLRVGVLLPLKENTPVRARMLEYYRGLLMAVDSLKHEGFSFEVHAFDIGYTVSDVKQVLARPEIKTLDVIFGPSDAEQIKAISDQTKDEGLKLISPFNSATENLEGNPNLFVLTAPQSVVNEDVMKLFISTFPKDNVVIINNGAETDPFIPALKANLRTIKAVSLPLTDKALMRQLDKKKDNVLVPSSASLSSVLPVLASLKELKRTHPEYRLKLFGYPSWQTASPTLKEDFHALNTYMYASDFCDELSEANRDFSNRYQHYFGQKKPADSPDMTVYGYDCGLYFLRGVIGFGHDFSSQRIAVRPLQTNFLMKRISAKGGLVNHAVLFIHYKPGSEMDLIQMQ